MLLHGIVGFGTGTGSQDPMLSPVSDRVLLQVPFKSIVITLPPSWWGSYEILGLADAKLLNLVYLQQAAQLSVQATKPVASKLVHHQRKPVQ